MTDTATTEAAAATTTEGAASTDTTAAAPTLLDTSAESSSTTAKEGDAKTEGEGATEGDKTADAKPEGAPAEYEAFKMPEGITLDPEVDTNLKTLAKDLNLSQEAAQKVADLGAQLSSKWTETLQAQIDATSNAWEQAAKADKEIGGDKLPENLGLAKTVLDKFGSPELRELLTTSRLGNNPEVIRLLSKVGAAISDDARVTSGKAPDASSKARVMFPSAQG